MSLLAPRRLVWLLLVALAVPASTREREAPSLLHHRLSVRLEPAAHRLEVSDTFRRPAGPAEGELRFSLHAGLAPRVETPGVSLDEVPGDLPADLRQPSDGGDGPLLAAYRLRSEGGGALPTTLTLRYGGKILHPPRTAREESARSFGETPGTIGPQGVYLAGSTAWVPRLGSELVTFSLEVGLPAGWEAVSEGRRALDERRAEGTRVRWEATHPGEEIHLVAAPFTVYEDRAGGVATYVYLRQPDPGLAGRYLAATSRYLEMYRRLLGDYPYAKLAVVESFWETGYGMASFTLLGPRVIRFPFILHSSLPHEILHDWWGNGVFVEPAGGNWSEGLTAYLADHLVREQRGQGAAYRRELLERYADFVRAGDDFPITRFRSRHSAATEAVGYGKTALFFHMLRRRLGEETFLAALRRFYGEERFRRASFADLERAFEAVSGEDLTRFFAAWLERPGAPELALARVAATPAGEGGFSLELELAQTQKGEPYPLEVPVAVSVEGEAEARVLTVPLEGRTAALDAVFPGRPLRLAVDPDFDLFRRLDPREVPPSLGRVFGAERALVVLPAAAPASLAAAYRALAEEWKETGVGEVRIARDDRLTALPGDRAVWVLGWENRFRPVVEEGVRAMGARLAGGSLEVAGRTLARHDRAVVVAVPHPDAPELAVGFVGADEPAALPGLTRKLPHYGKYGYLGFAGEEPTNVAEGSWEPAGSPLEAVLVAGSAAAPRPPRKALAELPPAFSEAALQRTVELLAADELEGRGCGSPGLARAAELIEAELRAAGLEPGAAEGGYRQTWRGACGEAGTPAEMVNLVGVIRGARADPGDGSVVVVAHYDHLGRGWPDVHAGDRGKIHNGADDNASGVAVLLALARALAAGPPPARSVVFLAVSGEEMGRAGSRRYASAAGPFPASRALAAVNLDTVGRLDDGKLLVLGVGSAAEWVHIVRGAGYLTGVPVETVADDLGASDQRSFLDIGVPAVQLTTGPHADYHRPGDDAEKVDVPGLVRIASFAEEIITYLAHRQEPLTSTLAGAAAESKPPPAAAGGRRVSLGSVPDFAYEGPGVRLAGVVPGSPAARAGLSEGDVLVRLGDIPVGTLRDLSRALASSAPGDRVEVVYRRGGEERRVEVVLVAR